MPFVGIKVDTMCVMPMTLRLEDSDVQALRRRAQVEGTSMQDVVQRAVRQYIEQQSRMDLVDQVLDVELPRYAEALERLSR